MYFLFILFIFLNLTESYFLTNFFNNPIIKKLSLKEFNINDYNNFLDKHINSLYLNEKIHDISLNIFKKVTTYLPDFHKAGDSVLNMNQNVINIVLNSDLDDEIKKNIITNLLDLTLVFDHAASHFLHIYQDFVHHIM